MSSESLILQAIQDNLLEWPSAILDTNAKCWQSLAAEIDKVETGALDFPEIGVKLRSVLVFPIARSVY